MYSIRYLKLSCLLLLFYRRIDQIVYEYWGILSMIRLIQKYNEFIISNELILV